MSDGCPSIPINTNEFNGQVEMKVWLNFIFIKVLLDVST